MRIRTLSVPAAFLITIVLTGCSDGATGSASVASSADPKPVETTMSQDQEADFFLDAICPSQSVFANEPTSGTFTGEQAWAVESSAKVSKTYDLLGDPGAKWPTDIASDVEDYRVIYPGVIDRLDAIANAKTATAARSIPQPTFDADTQTRAEAASDKLSARFDIDLGSSDISECANHL